jgi:hypothetical protein
MRLLSVALLFISTLKCGKEFSGESINSKGVEE